MTIRLVEKGEAFIIMDTSGRSVAYFYFDDGLDTTRRSVLGRLTKPEALEAAKACATALRDKEGTTK